MSSIWKKPIRVDLWFLLVCSICCYTISYGAVSFKVTLIGKNKIEANISSEYDRTASVWITHPTPTKQTLYDIAFNNAHVGLAVGSGGTILRSADGGLHWQSIDSHMIWDLRSVCFVDSATAVIAGFAGQILRSVDGGQNWVVVRSRTAAPLTNVHFEDSFRGLISGSDGTLLKTTDGGLNWVLSQISDFGTSIIYSAVRLSDSIVVAAGEYGQITRSTDNGLTWTYLEPRVVSDAIFHLVKTHNGTLIGVGGGTNTGFVIRSLDSGLTWTTDKALHTPSLKAACVWDTSRCLAVGLQGCTLFSADGAEQWIGDTLDLRTDMWGCTVDVKNVVWVCGVSGTIMSSEQNATEITEPRSDNRRFGIVINHNQIETQDGSPFGLAIFTMEGRQVFADPSYNARHEFAGIPAGVYLAQLKSASGSFVLKMYFD